MSRGGYRGRGDGVGRGGDRYGSSGYRDSFDRYTPKDYGSSRVSRDYRPRSLTPPDRDRGMSYYDRETGPSPRGYDYDRYGPGGDYRSPPGGRDYPPSRDYAPRGRDYMPPSSHRYAPESRDMDGRREYGMRAPRYDSSPPRSAPRREYESMPPSRGYSGPRYDGYGGSGGGPSRDYESVRGPPMSSRNAPPSDSYPRGPARGPPPRDERSRDAGMRRPLSRDDSPPAKRMKGLPPRSAPRGGPPPRRF